MTPKFVSPAQTILLRSRPHISTSLKQNSSSQLSFSLATRPVISPASIILPSQLCQYFFKTRETFYTKLSACNHFNGSPIHCYLLTKFKPSSFTRITASIFFHFLYFQSWIALIHLAYYCQLIFLKSKAYIILLTTHYTKNYSKNRTERHS